MRVLKGLFASICVVGLVWGSISVVSVLPEKTAMYEETTEEETTECIE